MYEHDARMPDNYTAEKQRNLDLAKEYISISYDPKRASADAGLHHEVPSASPGARIGDGVSKSRPAIRCVVATFQQECATRAVEAADST